MTEFTPDDELSGHIPSDSDQGSEVAEYGAILIKHSANSDEARWYKIAHPNPDFQRRAAVLDKLDAIKRQGGDGLAGVTAKV